MSDLVLAKTVDRQLLAGEIDSRTGDSVSFKRPHQFASKRTPTGDISGQAKNNLISGKATGKVGNYITVAVEYGQLEEAIKLNQLDEILAPVRERIVTDLETELAQFMMNNGALSLGTPNTPINKWSDVAQTASFLKDLGVKRVKTTRSWTRGLRSVWQMLSPACMEAISSFAQRGKMHRSPVTSAEFAR